MPQEMSESTASANCASIYYTSLMVAARAVENAIFACIKLEFSESENVEERSELRLEVISAAVGALEIIRTVRVGLVRERERFLTITDSNTLLNTFIVLEQLILELMLWVQDDFSEISCPREIILDLQEAKTVLTMVQTIETLHALDLSL